jgi:type VI protein secretion system component VasK
MNIDGQVFSYDGGNADFKQLTWPGNQQGVTLTVRSPGGSSFRLQKGGPWGIFHFLADARWQPTGPPYDIEVVLSSQGVTDPVSGKPYSARFDLDTRGAPPVFRRGFFSSLRCVSSVAK